MNALNIVLARAQNWHFMAKFPCLPPSKQDLLPSCPSGCSGTCGSSLPSSSDGSSPSSSPSGCGAAGAH
eukprot:1527962-Amphidinium_carterae.1